jgi:hypothetical protein
VTRDLRVLSPRLPYRTRARLRAEHHLTAVGAWLIDHGHTGAAERLWRACRML